jgi:glyoxylase-like metal-dependent hydrolase (beta-lactamase superfamily II)
MQTITITANLIQLTRIRAVNAFLVREADGFTLVDTMIGGSADGLIAAAHSAGGEIRRIALTHGHGDHVGSLDALTHRLGSDVEVLMGELDARIHAGERVTERKPKGGWPRLKTTWFTRVRAGDRIGSLEVIASPGHTPGHVSYLDTRERSLIAGDVFTAIGGLAVSSHFHWRFPFAAMATWDRAIDLDSARAVRRAEPAVLTVGHGGPVRYATSAMDEAIALAGRAAGRVTNRK